MRSGALAAPLLLLAFAVSAGPPLGAGSDSAAPADLEALMERLAAGGGVRARFRETRQLSLLTEPIETRGVLHFAPPDLLARQTTWPGRSSIVVRDGRVALRDETGHQVIELGNDAVARHFAENLALLLRGDLAALRGRYEIRYRTDGSSWVLELEPRSPRLREIVSWTRFEGRGSGISSMETRETSGDSILTVFADVETGLVRSASEIESIFSLEDPGGSP